MSSFAHPYRRLLTDAREGAAPVARAQRGRTPSRPARLRAWARQERLDRWLLDGEAPTAGLLAVRAWQLTSPRACARIARTLSAAIDEAQEPRPRRGAAVPVCRDEVDVAHAELVRAIARLRDPRPVRPRGIVMLRRLLADGDGPLYAARANDELWRRVRRASIALD